MTPTQRIAEASGQTIVKEFAPSLYAGCDFTAFNSGSPEIEVCEFLYSLIRLIKPVRILETGTHYGLSAAYMGLALQANARGVLTTLEVDQRYRSIAQQLFEKLDLNLRVECILCPSLQFDAENASEIGHVPIDFLFLDSEPEFRFKEFVRFFPRVAPGGFIAIHDLHPHLGHTDTTEETTGMYDWPYGDPRPKLGRFILEHQVQIMSFPTPRGLTLFQKMTPDHGVYNILTGKW